MQNSNYVKSHGVLIQGNAIQAKERLDMTFAKQLALIKKELDTYFEKLEAGSCPSLNTVYTVQTYTPEGNYGNVKVELDYTDKLIEAIKRVTAKKTIQ